MENIKHTGWRNDLAGLRGLAILSVLVFHAVPAWLPGGFVGVDIFFVLSGFLVGSLLLSDIRAGTLSLYLFYAKRSRRLFPALLTVLCATAFAASFLLPGREMLALGQQIAASSVFAANFLAWAQSGYFSEEAAYKPLIHLWSLGIEEQFYLIFPVVLVYLARTRSIAGIRNFIAVVGLISFVDGIFMTYWKPEAAFYSPLTRFWELLAGSWLACQTMSHPVGFKRWQEECLGLAGLVLLAGSFVGINERSAFPGWVAAFPVAGTLLLITAGPGTICSRYFLSRTIMLWLGGVSYAAYLWHWPILVLARYYQGDALSIPVSLALIIISLGLAWMTTKWIETPFRTGIWSRKRYTPAVLWGSLAAMAVLIIPATSYVVADEYPALAKLDQYGRPEGDPWRNRYNCFIGLNEDKRFGKECYGNSGQAGQVAVLWGDSHAASLWAGLSAEMSKRGIGLGQFTSSWCAPLIKEAGDGNKSCDAIRAQTLAALQVIKPSTVIVLARWAQGYDLAKVRSLLRPTIDHLKAIGVRNVIVLGPLPMWKPSLASTLAIDMRRQHLVVPPLDTERGLQPDPFQVDKMLADLAAADHFRYVSLIAILCKERKCRAWADPDTKTALMTFDDAHLSVEGSSVLSRFIVERIFDEKTPPASMPVKR